MGIFQAKTHLSELVEAVEAGETIIITKRGKVIAHHSPPFPIVEKGDDPLVSAFRKFQKSVKPGKESPRDLINLGRKR